MVRNSKEFLSLSAVKADRALTRLPTTRLQPKKINTKESLLSTPHQAITLAITSGKGGVGKSNTTINLAITLAQQGAKVCIFDADSSLANINILIGLSAKYNIEHLLSGVKSLDDIMLKGPANVSIIPASSGIASLDNLDEEQKSRLVNALKTLEQRFDYLLIDTAAGIDKNVTRFLKSANAILLIISTEPTSLTDAFALLRVLKRSHYTQTTHVLVNMAINYSSGMEVFKRFEGAVRKYLHLKLSYSGYITDDIAVKDAIRQQCPVVLYRPDSLATRCFINLQKVLVNQLPANKRSDKFSSFWKDLLSPKKDTFQNTHITEILHNKPLLPGEVRQGILNAIRASQLGTSDVLTIILALANSLKPVKNNSALQSSKSQQQLSLILNKLQPFDQTQHIHSDANKWKNSVIQLTSSGNALEHKLDKLIIDLEKILA